VGGAVESEISEILVPHLGKTVGIHGVSAESPRRERETDGGDSAAGRINPAWFYCLDIPIREVMPDQL
jgi:hypothetical protein